MRIDDLNRTPVAPGAEKAGQTAQSRPSEGTIAGLDQSDQAELSPLAQNLAAPDPGRTEQLRLEVQSGSYDVSAQTVANALIDAHLKD